MKCRIIIIGDEILIGQVTDTNSGAIARAMEPLGFEICGVETVPDDATAIRSAVDRALNVAELVVTTGGLGPTKDDITKRVLTEIFGGELRHDPAVLENIRHVFQRRHLRLNALTEAQALVPTSCRVIQNRLGTAPIMWFERDGHVLVSMPGVPFETEGMLPEVVRRVKDTFACDRRLLHHSLMVTGITESALAQRLEEFEESLSPALHLAYLPTPGMIRLRLDGNAPESDPALEADFNAALAALRELLGDNLIYDGDATSAEILLSRLRARSLTMATAESCTGGNIAHRITSVAGSSDVFLGGVVSYANEVKATLLDVSKEDLATHGAVSQPVVEQMASGVCRATGARCACATSGIAGPGGGSPEKPVGTVWIGWCVDGHVSSRLFHLPGDRARVIDRATTEALLGLIQLL